MGFEFCFELMAKRGGLVLTSGNHVAVDVSKGGGMVPKGPRIPCVSGSFLDLCDLLCFR